MVAHLGAGMPGERFGARVAAVGPSENHPARSLPQEKPGSHRARSTSRNAIPWGHGHENAYENHNENQNENQNENPPLPRPMPRAHGPEPQNPSMAKHLPIPPERPLTPLPRPLTDDLREPHPGPGDGALGGASMYRGLAALAAMGIAGSTGPSAVCELGAGGWYQGDPETIEPFAAALSRQVEAPLGEFGTGSALFDGEWRFGTYQMAALGFGQAALADPAHRTENLARMRVAIDHALAHDVWAFDRAEWGDVALADLAHDRHDHAVLGYLGLALGLERTLDPHGPHAEIHDAVAAHLARRLAIRGEAPIQTYPGEAYPVDMAAVLGALALHAKSMGQPVPPAVDAAVRHWEAAYVADDGLLAQAVHPTTGHPGTARGSGTALAAYFLGFTHPDVSARLRQGIRHQLAENAAGFGGVREYRRGEDGSGDIDSGPLIAGFSVSATGFSLAAARQSGDEAWFADLYGTACMFGVPGDEGFLTGGPIGNAILFAMMTAPR